MSDAGVSQVSCVSSPSTFGVDGVVDLGLCRSCAVFQASRYRTLPEFDCGPCSAGACPFMMLPVVLSRQVCAARDIHLATHHWGPSSDVRIDLCFILDSSPDVHYSPSPVVPRCTASGYCAWGGTHSCTVFVFISAAGLLCQQGTWLSLARSTLSLNLPICICIHNYHPDSKDLLQQAFTNLQIQKNQ